MHFEIHGLIPKKAEAMKAKIAEEIKKIKDVHEKEMEEICIEIYPTQIDNLNGYEKPYLRFFRGTLVREEAEILRSINKLIDIRIGGQEICYYKEN
jgi:hypothetical protein